MFFYTDGVTEATNTDNALYSNDLTIMAMRIT